MRCSLGLPAQGNSSHSGDHEPLIYMQFMQAFIRPALQIKSLPWRCKRSSIPTSCWGSPAPTRLRNASPGRAAPERRPVRSLPLGTAKQAWSNGDGPRMMFFLFLWGGGLAYGNPSAWVCSRLLIPVSESYMETDVHEFVLVCWYQFMIFWRIVYALLSQLHFVSNHFQGYCIYIYIYWYTNVILYW